MTCAHIRHKTIPNLKSKIQNGMKRPFYIFSNGRLCRRQNTVYLEKSGEERTPDDTESDEGKPSSSQMLGRVPLPIEQIEGLYCFGEVDINSKLITFLGQNSVPVFFYDYYGNFTATLYPRDYLLSGRLKVAQAKHYLQNLKRMQLARIFVDTAAYNILRVLKYYQPRLTGDSAQAVQQTILWIESLRLNIPNMRDTQALMGIEGNIRDAYYRTWGYLLGDAIKEKFPFDKRERNPPSNELNALISFGNAMCYSATLRQIYRTALDPTISYLHEPGERRFSLALDMSEIFKPLLVDRAIFRLLKTGVIQPKHFEERLGGVFLKENGRKLFVEHWDERLRQTIQHRALNRKVSYERLIRLECYQLTRYLMDPKNETYEGFRMWW
jgi:CRISPR-associated protein Cas1